MDHDAVGGGLPFVLLQRHVMLFTSINEGTREQFVVAIGCSETKSINRYVNIQKVENRILYPINYCFIDFRILWGNFIVT